MRFVLVITIVAATVVLIAAGLVHPVAGSGTVGIASGGALPVLAPRPDTPEHALSLCLTDLQRRDWHKALSTMSDGGVDEQSLALDWAGSDGGLRSFSSLEGFDLWPLHATGNDAQIRTRLHWSTPVGPVEDVRDFHLVRDGEIWKVVWPKPESTNTAAQVVPVNYLRWDLVTTGAQDAWGSHNVDAPHVRIISMNALDTPTGAVVIGEVVNEDSVPAFVNVNSTLIDASGKAIDEESSFDRIAHVLLPKQVSPYRIDFPGIQLSEVKSVHMDVRPTLVPASADPVVGVIDQKMEQDAQGNPVLHGKLQNQSGETVNVPHVIASFYDSNGKVIWVSDGYVDRALPPLGSETFAVQLPRNLGSKVQTFHVVVNHYSLQES